MQRLLGLWVAGVAVAAGTARRAPTKRMQPAGLAHPDGGGCAV